MLRTVDGVVDDRNTSSSGKFPVQEAESEFFRKAKHSIKLIFRATFQYADLHFRQFLVCRAGKCLILCSGRNDNNPQIIQITQFKLGEIKQFGFIFPEFLRDRARQGQNVALSSPPYEFHDDIAHRREKCDQRRRQR